MIEQHNNSSLMFSKLKAKASEKMKVLKKAAFLALVSYLYDIIANAMKKKKQDDKFVENVEYEVKDKNSGA
ncbi:MAG: hypothetical protein WC788_06335 [Candidatus Paceibacterota bacterium]|jgi:hypothetical protein